MEKPTKEEGERLQRILGELSDYQTTAEVLRQQFSLLTTSLSELSVSLEVIKIIKGLKPGTEILVPVGADSFITTTLAAADKVITGLGADVAAERSTEDAIKVLESRKAELERALGQASEELGKLDEKIEALRPEAESILEKIRKKQP